MKVRATYSIEEVGSRSSSCFSREVKKIILKNFNFILELTNSKDKSTDQFVFQILGQQRTNCHLS